MAAMDPDPESIPDLEALFAQQQWLLRLAKKLVWDNSAAMDLVQDTFLAALENPPLDASRPQAWLAVVARRILRKQHLKLSPVCREELDSIASDVASLPDEAIIRWESLNLLHEAVKNLEPRKKKAIILVYQEHLSQKEAANQLKISSRTLRTWLKASYRDMRKTLGEDQGTLHGAWALPLVPVLDPKWFVQKSAAATGTIAVGVSARILSTTGIAVLVGVATLGTLLLTGGHGETPTALVGMDEESPGSGGQNLLDSSPAVEEQREVLAELSEGAITTVPLLEVGPEPELSPTVPADQVPFCVSLLVRFEAGHQTGLWANLTPEGFTPTLPVIQESRKKLDDNGNARVCVQQQGGYRMIVAPVYEQSDGKPSYGKIVQMAYRGDDLNLTLKIPETSSVTLRISQPEVWIQMIGQLDGWKVEAIGTAAPSGEIPFTDVPLGHYDVRTYEQVPNGNREREFTVLGTFTVEADSENLFTIK